MSKNVLILSASPRKGGNSDTVCDQFGKGAQEAGNHVEKLRLAELHIEYCSACYACKKLGHCVKRDDMAMVIDKMKASDVIVLATPVYFYSMDGQMKTFIDRTVPRYTEITNKDFYFIMTAADTDSANLNRTMETFRGFTEDCLDGAREAGIIYGTGAWQVGEIETTPAYEEAYAMGKRV